MESEIRNTLTTYFGAYGLIMFNKVNEYYKVPLPQKEVIKNIYESLGTNPQYENFPNRINYIACCLYEWLNHLLPQWMPVEQISFVVIILSYTLNPIKHISDYFHFPTAFLFENRVFPPSASRLSDFFPLHLLNSWASPTRN